MWCHGGVTLATILGDGGSFALDQTDVYFTDFKGPGSGAIHHVSKAGGALTSLTTSFGPLLIALDAANVYVTSPDGLARVAKSGGAPTLFTPFPYMTNNVLGFAVDSTHVYFANASSEIKRIPLGGGTIETVATHQAISSIKLDAQNVYWTVLGSGSTAASGTLMKMSKSGGAPVVLAANLDQPSDLALDATGFAWINRGGFSLVKMDLSGGAPMTVLGPLQQTTAPYGVALDATHLYWGGENIGKAPRGGGAIVGVVPALANTARELALDDTSVFWSENFSTPSANLYSICKAPK